MNTKFIFVTGGVVSSLGKGISASSIGQLLKLKGIKVFMQKFDPYINVDPGQMSPFQHGEVFITDDGAETDLDLGHYERFIDERLNKYSSITSGKIYKRVIEKERQDKYNGATVQVIPHITNEIKNQLKKAAKYSNADVIITEIGGTVGDIESLPFLEAIRQCRREFGVDNTLYVHNTLVPFLKSANEVKTKPTQHSVKALMSLGITPDMLLLRSEKVLGKEIREKIAKSCDVPIDGVFEATDVKVIFENIINLHKQNIEQYILKTLKIENNTQSNLEPWSDLIKVIKSTKHSVNIGLVAKFVSLHDAYLSVNESLKYAGYHNATNINISWIDARYLDSKNISDNLKEMDGIILGDGYGSDSLEGVICAAKYGREKNIPTFAISHGMHAIAIEFARNVLKIKDATTQECIDCAGEHIICEYNDFDKKQKDSYILGAREQIFETNSKLYSIYEENNVMERHNNQFIFNDLYIKLFEKNNFMKASHIQENNIITAIELKEHIFYIGVQYRPEFLSRPLRPHKLFYNFIKTVKENKDKK